MADVFLSYAREDRDRACVIAEALEARGWLVFWDRKLLGGQEFRPVLERELQSARCVVVLWSARSLASKFVRDEAQEALNGRLVPALIEPVEPPLGFREIQHADLSKWDGDPADDEFLRFVSAVQAVAPLGEHTVPPPPRDMGWRSRLRRIPRARTLALATAGVFVLAGVASCLVRLPADVDLEVEARAVSFRVNGADNVALFSGLRLDSLTMQNLEVVKSSSSDVFATVTDPSRKAALTVDKVTNFTLNVPRQTAVEFSATPEEPGTVKVVFTKGQASAIFTASVLRTMRCPACQGDAAVLASLVGKPASLQVDGDPVRTTAFLASTAPVSVATLDVDSIAFYELVGDRFVSTVLGGTIAFRNGGMQTETLKNNAALTLRDLSGASIALTGERNLRLRLVARAGGISITEGGVRRDLRPTVFAVLTHWISR